MRDTDEELKEIEMAQEVEKPTLQDIEAIFKDCYRKSVAELSRPLSIKRRLYPECYRAFSLNTVPIKCLHEETLFYIFYTLYGADLQVKAYNELIFRNYLYSTTLDCFVIHNYAQVADGKKKSIIIFDPIEWQKLVKEVVFDQGFIDGLMSYVEEIDLTDDEDKAKSGKKRAE